MDFFEQQDVARRRTGRLVLLFGLAVLGIIAAAYCVVAGVLVAGQDAGPGGARSLLDWRLLGAVGAGTVLVVALGSGYKLRALAAGGPAVAEHLGGKLLHGGNADAEGRRLLNVVDEMAIASGIPAPQVYLLPDEEGINAFAAGHDPDDAVIGVTRGALRHLDRDELQGVIGHEFSHILNGDMRLNLRLMALLHGILVIGLVGHVLLRSMHFTRHGARGRGKGGGGVAAVMAMALGLMAVGFAGVFFGNLIKAAVSRQREHLADASAVQFTRQPDGIAGALKKIGGLGQGSRLAHPHAPEASHMYTAEGVPRFTRLFATHPPLEERIRRIDPGWDGRWPVLDTATAGGAGRDRGRGEAARGTAGGAAPTGTAAFGAGAFLAASALEQAGHPAAAHVEAARRLIGSLPPEVARALSTPYGARAAVLGMLLSHDAEVRRAQREILRRRSEGAADAPATAALLRDVAGLETPLLDMDAALRLPLLDLALPALRSLSSRQTQELDELVTGLVEADERVELFEWVLRRQLRRHLFAGRPRVRAAGIGGQEAIARARRAVHVVLAALVHAAGEGGRAAAHASARRSAERLGLGHDFPLPERGHFDPAELDGALDRLVALPGSAKRDLLAACAACITADGEVRVEETELLRALADALEVPVPPLLPGQRLAPPL